MNTFSVFKLTEYGEEVKPQLHLRHSEWDILLSINGKESLSEITRRLNLKPDEVRSVIEQLLAYEIIEEQTLSYEEYLHISGKGGQACLSTSSGSAENSRPVLNLPPVPTSSNTPKPEPPTRKTTRSLSVNALINFIISKAPSATEGQIAVYRVFLRVPPELLKKNAISSLSLVDDQTTVEDPELQSSLASAVEQMLQVSLPDSVFA